MKRIVPLTIIVAILLMLAAAGIYPDANPTHQILTGILKKMEKAHQELKSLKAEMILQKTNSQINITDTEYAALMFKPSAGKGKQRLRIDYTKPSKNIV